MPVLYRTDTASEADLRVFVTDIRSEADLAVFETMSNWEATEPAVWAYTDIRAEADRVVHFTGNRWDADLCIFRTGIQSDAGWIDTAKSMLL
ncbi:MAG: hypothetical protein AVO35_05375 [Candidatus Aegiribacteria sp. MLS_C]|nr:MAG: hypothetical protein AVO35_05375 [Candidatus Aegiribacteria sp. MLS_C]